MNFAKKLIVNAVTRTSGAKAVVTMVARISTDMVNKRLKYMGHSLAWSIGLLEGYSSLYAKAQLESFD